MDDDSYNSVDGMELTSQGAGTYWSVPQSYSHASKKKHNNGSRKNAKSFFYLEAFSFNEIKFIFKIQ